MTVSQSHESVHLRCSTRLRSVARVSGMVLLLWLLGAGSTGCCSAPQVQPRTLQLDVGTVVVNRGWWSSTVALAGVVRLGDDYREYWLIKASAAALPLPTRTGETLKMKWLSKRADFQDCDDFVRYCQENHRRQFLALGRDYLRVSVDVKIDDCAKDTRKP